MEPLLWELLNCIFVDFAAAETRGGFLTLDKEGGGGDGDKEDRNNNSNSSSSSQDQQQGSGGVAGALCRLRTFFEAAAENKQALDDVTVELALIQQGSVSARS